MAQSTYKMYSFAKHQSIFIANVTGNKCNILQELSKYWVLLPAEWPKADWCLSQITNIKQSVILYSYNPI